jgi:DNA-binding XRE family transcriptional regulator
MARPFNFAALRGKLSLDQVQMAERMGISLEELLALEAAGEEAQRAHQLLAHMVSLEVAIERSQPGLASTTMREKIMAWYRLAAATPGSG